MHIDTGCMFCSLLFLCAAFFLQSYATRRVNIQFDTILQKYIMSHSSANSTACELNGNGI